MKYSRSLRKTANYLSRLSVSCAYILMTMLFFVVEEDQRVDSLMSRQNFQYYYPEMSIPQSLLLQLHKQLRQKYWVPRGRPFLRSLARKSVTCRKTDGPPSVPHRGLHREYEGQALSTTGVGYAGTLYVKGSTRDKIPTKGLSCLVLMRIGRVSIEEFPNLSYFVHTMKSFATGVTYQRN